MGFPYIEKWYITQGIYEILHQMDNSVLSGHLGKKKTKEDINIWIQQCEICGAIKPPAKASMAPLESMPTGAPCDRLDTDILGSMPVNPTGNIYNLTVTDYFTKWIQVFPIPDQTAVVDLDVPLLYIQIRAESMSEIFQELCELLEIRKTRTSPNNPKANGQMERFNRTLLAMIKSYLRGEQTNWDLNLGCLVGAYRATPNESTGLAPNLLLFGREIRMPYEIVKERISFGLEENSKNWG